MNFIISRSIFFIFLLSLIGFSFSSCDDSDDNDKMYLYLPYELNINDSTYYTKYTYNNNRPTEIILLEKDKKAITIDSTYIAITYNSEGNPLDMVVEAGYNREDTLGNPIYEVHQYTFSYQGGNVSVNKNKIQLLSIELNERGQAAKCTNHQEQTSLTYEYHSNGNISKTMDNDGVQYTYQYDNKRGMFREVNVPQWFINTIFAIQLDILDQKVGQSLSIYNNCTSITATNTDGSTNTDNSYNYNYTGFRYPASITDATGLRALVKYKPVP